eukprot:3726699-Amphidinium_carterae.1
MALHSHTQRKIQKNTNDGKLTEGPPSGLRAEGGTHGDTERMRTSFDCIVKARFQSACQLVHVDMNQKLTAKSHVKLVGPSIMYLAMATTFEVEQLAKCSA